MPSTRIMRYLRRRTERRCRKSVASPSIRSRRHAPAPGSRSSDGTRRREDMERIVYRFPTVEPHVMRTPTEPAYGWQATPAKVPRGAIRSPRPSTTEKELDAESFPHRSPSETSFLRARWDRWCRTVQTRRCCKIFGARRVDFFSTRPNPVTATRRIEVPCGDPLRRIHWSNEGDCCCGSTAAAGELVGIELRGRSWHCPRPSSPHDENFPRILSDA